MALTAEQIETAAKKGTQAAIKEELGRLFVDRETHFLDHQYIKQMKEAGHNDDHKFLQGARKDLGRVKAGGLVFIGASIVTGIGYAIKTWIQNIGQ
jgi:hypothetical protein